MRELGLCAVQEGDKPLILSEPQAQYIAEASWLIQVFFDHSGREIGIAGRSARRWEWFGFKNHGRVIKEGHRCVGEPVVWGNIQPSPDNLAHSR